MHDYPQTSIIITDNDDKSTIFYLFAKDNYYFPKFVLL